MKDVAIATKWRMITLSKVVAIATTFGHLNVLFRSQVRTIKSMIATY